MTQDAGALLKLAEDLRETAGQLINGVLGDGAVSTFMLLDAASALEAASQGSAGGERSAVQTDDDLLERLDDQGLYSKAERIQMIKDAAAEIRRLRGAAQAAWMPIETAPKDGTDFLALCEYQRKHHQMVGCFAPNGKFASWPGRNNYHPTHWMPLPSFEQPARGPKVRTSHHRNKEEAARLQAIVDEKYAASSVPSAHRGGE